MTRILTVAALALALVAGGSWLFMSQGSSTNSTSFELPGAAHAQEAGEVDTSQIVEMIMGAEDAPIEIIEYASYTCPHCGNFHNGPFKDLKKDYIDTGKVKFIYREVYFDKYGMWASMIARCEPTKFFGITDLLYKGQQTWARAGSDAAIAGELRKIGALAGIAPEQLETCLSDGAKLQALVAWYQENATADGVRSTPSFVIDGELFSNMDYSSFKELLDGKL